MITNLRRLAKSLLPARAVHAYRMLRHTVLMPAERELALVPRFLSRDAVAIDIGANVGLYTAVLARHALQVLAFEPHPACAAYLRSLGIPRCEVIEAAASSTDGEAMLRVPDDGRGENPALATLAESNGFGTGAAKSLERAIPIATVRLDSVLAKRVAPATRIGFVKIDVEGHEASVLRGAIATLSRHKPVLLVEVEARHGGDIDGLFTMLGELAYRAYVVDDGGSLQKVDAASLRRMQTPELLARKLARPRDTGYVNNVFFLPVAG